MINGPCGDAESLCDLAKAQVFLHSFLRFQLRPVNILTAIATGDLDAEVVPWQGNFVHKTWNCFSAKSHEKEASISVSGCAGDVTSAVDWLI